ncbi:hypothetical protein DY245_42085 [Streptomyces inhibens]|uniref:Uncharacterized protein n=1 Tax=Streptomyces inhibens TaxID=2293571 RepID=A0A371PQ72_STRIH|nr:hypothetical protein [Streptomyces inhibens]REK84655.1 hypothetical protein DY245_42085 [Streptomyces inhibens]
MVDATIQVSRWAFQEERRLMLPQLEKASRTLAGALKVLFEELELVWQPVRIWTWARGGGRCEWRVCGGWLPQKVESDEAEHPEEQPSGEELANEGLFCVAVVPVGFVRQFRFWHTFRERS